MSQISHYTVLTTPRTEGKGVSLKASVFGNPPESGRFILFPGGHTVRLKSVIHSNEGKAVILELKGLARSRFRTGDVLIAAETGVSEGRKALVLWKKKIAAGDSLSLSLRDNPEISSPDAVSCREGDKAVLLSSRIPFIQIPGQIYTLTQGKMRGECLLLMAEPWTAEEQKKIKARMGKINNFPGEEAVISMNLRVRGAMVLPPHLKERNFEGAVKMGDWILMSRLYDKAVSTLEKRARSEEGINETDLSELLNLPLGLCHQISDSLIDSGKLIRRKGHLFNQCDDHRDFLSPMSRMWLSELAAAGEEGFSLKETFKLGSRLEAMERRGLLRIFETFVIEENVFASLLDRLLDELPRDRSFELSDIKGILNLSRSRLLLLLGVLEEEGKIVTDDNHKRRLVRDEPESGSGES